MVPADQFDDDPGLDDAALVHLAAGLAADLDDDRYWNAVREPHRRGGQTILESISGLARSEDPRLRRCACDVAGQLGYPEGQPMLGERFAMLASVAANEQSPFVLAGALTALGHLGLPESLSLLVACADHEDPEVRFSVAVALSRVVEDGWIDKRHVAVTTLMRLTTDEDADVRDWAVFGLGTLLMTDGPLVRQCLLARAEDPDDDTRAEAILGLARRHAPEAVELVEQALCGEYVDRLAVEAAEVLGDPGLATPLDRLRDRWDVDPDLLDAACERCRPTRVADEAVMVHELLLAADRLDLPLSIYSGWFSFGCTGPIVEVARADKADVDAFGDLLRRAGGSPAAAIELIRRDLTSQPGPQTPETPAPRPSVADC